MTEYKVYTPIEDVKSETIFTSEINQIPPYEDSGIKYQGKYKTQVSGNKYELKTQQTRFYTFSIANDTDFNIIPRVNTATTRFYCNLLIITDNARSGWGAAIYDVLGDTEDGINSTPKFAWYPNSAGSTLMIIDFSNCPRLFNGDFTYYRNGWIAGQFTGVTLYGWEEQK